MAVTSNPNTDPYGNAGQINRTYRQSSVGVAAKTYDNGHSLIEVQLDDGKTVLSLIAPVNPAITQSLLSDMARDGFLTIRNTQESICVRAETVKAIRVTKITTDDNP